MTIRSARILNGNSNKAAHFRVETNNLGFFSKFDYPKNAQDKDRHFDIVVLGDSMTGIRELNGDQWVDQLQEILNKSDFSEAIGGKTVRTFKLGWPGAGFEHVWSAYEDYGQKFNPDLIVVNYIEQDFPRTIAGPHLDSDSEILSQAEISLDRFQKTGKPTLYLIMPELVDLQMRDRPYRYSSKLQNLLPEIELVDVRSTYPTHLTSLEITSLFSMPFDGHPSDTGATVYAHLVAQQIFKKFNFTPKNYKREKNPCSNILKNSKFLGLPDRGSPLALNVSKTVGDWQLTPDGQGGKGESEVSVETSSDKDYFDELTNVLVWQQLSGSTEGLPSLSQISTNISNVASQYVVSFHAQSENPMELLLNVFFHEKDKGDHYIATKTFNIKNEWQKFSLQANIPDSAKSGYIRITLAPTPKGKVFQLN